MTNKPHLISPEKLESMIRGWQTNRILLTAIELDIFTHLELPASSAYVADTLETAPRHTDRLLNALATLGVIEKKEGRFVNGVTASKHLVPGKPDYWMSLHHLNNMWNSWTRLTDVVRYGQPARTLPDTSQASLDWADHFIAAMQQFGSLRAPAVFDKLELKGAKKALDLGGGSGAFAVELAGRYPELSVVIFDLPDILPLTRGYIEKSGFADRISYTGGDFLVNEYGSGFDVVFMSNVIHSNGPEEIQNMFRRAYQALKPNCKLVVHDFMPGEDRTAPPWAVTFALNMLVHTENGDTYTVSEVTDWMAAAGFINIKHKDTGMNSDLVIGIKRADG